MLSTSLYVQDVMPVVLTNRHSTIRIKEHLETVKKYHIFSHPVNNENCKALRFGNCFETNHSASSLYKLKLKEAHNLKEVINNSTKLTTKINVEVSL